jgi:hypothetical protein
MNSKICTKCLINKPLDEFAKDSRGRLGRRSDCKICNCERSKRYQKLHLEQVLAKNRAWVSKNLDHVKEYRRKNLPRDRERTRLRYANDETFRIKKIKNAREFRKDPNNKQKILSTQRKLAKEYRKNPIWRIKANLRRRLCFVLHGKRKAEHTFNLIGCTLEQLKQHLESQFTEGMRWDNYGRNGWHIDHIKPCDAFDFSKPEDQKACFHYTNLRPLWAKDNLSKGSKIIS